MDKRDGTEIYHYIHGSRVSGPAGLEENRGCLLLLLTPIVIGIIAEICI